MEQVGTPCRGQSAAYASVFGPFQLRAPDHHEISITNRRARALLAILCLVGDEVIERDFLSKLLWPGRFEAHARASLRQCLLDLGKLLAPHGAGILNVSRSSVALRPGAVTTDLAALERALASGDFPAAIAQIDAIGTKPILDQMDFGAAFNQWLARRSGDAERRLHAAVEAGLATLERAGDRDTSARLRDAWSARGREAPPVPAAAAGGGRTRIAVLPFQSVGGGGAPDYFADGVVEELITALGQVPQLLVAGRTSSFHFRDSPLAPPDIAKALRVSHLVEGSVQRQGERLRVHIHLIDGATGFESWAQRYDGSLDGIFALQATVAQAVTNAVGNVLGIAMAPPPARGMTGSKQAYDLFLQGRSLSARVFGDGLLETAVDLLEQAVALDPQFAEAWVALAEAHQLIAVYTPCLDRRAASERMADCARTAIGLAPGLGYAYSLLGVHRWTQNDVVGALDLAFQGYRLEPNNPAVCMRLGSFLLYCGRTTEAMQYVEAAIDQDPVDGRKFNLRSVGRFNLGDIDGAIEAGQRMVDLGFPSMWLAVATAASGQHDLAIEQYQQTRMLLNKVIFPPAGTDPMPPAMMEAYWHVAAHGVCSAREEDRATYCAMLDMMRTQLHDPADASIVLPAIFMGYPERLFEAVSHAITPANTLCLLSIWADIDPIRRIWQHPEFIPFAQRIGLAAAWDKYGWPDVLPAPSNRVETPPLLPN
jgi:TolB-like protein